MKKRQSFKEMMLPAQENKFQLLDHEQNGLYINKLLNILQKIQVNKFAILGYDRISSVEHKKCNNNKKSESRSLVASAYSSGEGINCKRHETNSRAMETSHILTTSWLSHDRLQRAKSMKRRLRKWKFSCVQTVPS